ncbi:MAG: hypothetical protein AAB451_00590 [Patescibacteria group bacterium]
MNKTTNKLIAAGFLGGAIGGAVVDLIYITFVGPSGLFTLMGITERFSVFLSHVILGGILGMFFGLLVKRFASFNIYLMGLIFGLLCLGIIGGIPSSALGLVDPKATLFGFIVWLLFGLILAKTIKIFSKN